MCHNDGGQFFTPREVIRAIAVNPHKSPETDRRTPAELLDLIETKGREITEALAILRSLTPNPSPSGRGEF